MDTINILTSSDCVYKFYQNFIRFNEKYATFSIVYFSQTISCEIRNLACLLKYLCFKEQCPNSVRKYSRFLGTTIFVSFVSRHILNKQFHNSNNYIF